MLVSSKIIKHADNKQLDSIEHYLKVQLDNISKWNYKGIAILKSRIKETNNRRKIIEINAKHTQLLLF